MARTDELGGLLGLSGLSMAGLRGCALQQQAEAYSAAMLTIASHPLPMPLPRAL